MASWCGQNCLWTQVLPLNEEMWKSKEPFPNQICFCSFAFVGLGNLCTKKWTLSGRTCCWRNWSCRWLQLFVNWKWCQMGKMAEGAEMSKTDLGDKEQKLGGIAPLSWWPLPTRPSHQAAQGQSASRVSVRQFFFLKWNRTETIVAQGKDRRLQHNVDRTE